MPNFNRSLYIAVKRSLKMFLHVRYLIFYCKKGHSVNAA